MCRDVCVCSSLSHCLSLSLCGLAFHGVTSRTVVPSSRATSAFHPPSPLSGLAELLRRSQVCMVSRLRGGELAEATGFFLLILAHQTLSHLHSRQALYSVTPEIRWCTIFFLRGMEMLWWNWHFGSPLPITEATLQRLQRRACGLFRSSRTK